MSKQYGPFQFTIAVSADTPEEESRCAKLIAAEFLRQGIDVVSLIADGEHIHYSDGQVYNMTDILNGVSFDQPTEPPAAYVTAHRSLSIN